MMDRKSLLYFFSLLFLTWYITQMLPIFYLSNDFTQKYFSEVFVQSHSINVASALYHVINAYVAWMPANRIINTDAQIPSDLTIIIGLLVLLMLKNCFVRNGCAHFNYSFRIFLSDKPTQIRFSHISRTCFWVWTLINWYLLFTRPQRCWSYTYIYDSMF